MKKIIALLLCMSFCMSGFTTKKSDISKWDKKRPIRSKTLFIVLHTTEGSDRSSYNTVKRYGTCNFLVQTDGSVKAIISENKVAKHAGRSMWNNNHNLSDISVGIEVVGYHNKRPTAKQIISLKTLLTRLQKTYKLSDEKVITHSMCAYGSPNRWFGFKHRGRKHCARGFATEEIRQLIGLSNVFTIDPDVAAGRLKNADPYLAKLLYGKAKLDPKEAPQKIIKGITDKKSKNDDAFEGFQTIGRKGIWGMAGNEYNTNTTIYFFNDGRILTGDKIPEKEFNSLQKGTKVLVGYVYGGKIKKTRTAYSVLGKVWNSPSTFYYFPHKEIKAGDEVNGFELPLETIILFRK